MLAADNDDLGHTFMDIFTEKPLQELAFLVEYFDHYPLGFLQKQQDHQPGCGNTVEDNTAFEGIDHAGKAGFPYYRVADMELPDPGFIQQIFIPLQRTNVRGLLLVQLGDRLCQV